MKTAQEIREYIAAHPGLSNSKVADNLRRHGVKSADVAAARNGGVPAVQRPAGQGKALTVLLDQFDDVKKVRQAMRSLAKDHFVEDDEMRRNLGISIGRWRDVRQHNALAGFLYKLPNARFVWMHPQAQEQLTAAINLSQS